MFKHVARRYAIARKESVGFVGLNSEPSGAASQHDELARYRFIADMRERESGPLGLRPPAWCEHGDGPRPPPSIQQSFGAENRNQSTAGCDLLGIAPFLV